MASVFLDSNDTFTVSNNNVKVYGGNGSEVVTIATGLTGVTFDQSVERVALPGAFSSYTYQQQGINLLAYNSSNVLVATIPVLSGVTAITTTSGTSTVAIAAGGVMKLGDSTVTAGTTAAQATAVAPITINNALVTPGGSTTTTPISGSAFTLTASSNPTTGGIDNVVGTTADDNVLGILDTKTPTNNSLSSGDQIDGAAGTDTLQVTVVGDGTTAAALTASGIVIGNLETLRVINAITDGTKAITFDASTITGLKTVSVASSITGDTKLTNQASLVDASIANGKGDLTLSYTSAVTNGSADTQKLTLNGATGGTFTANGIETIAVTVTGVASTDVVLASNVGTKVTVAGAVNVGLSTDIKTVDATALTGALTLTNSNAAAQVTGGTGNDKLTVTTLTKDIKFAGGDGVDTLVVANTSFNSDAFTNVSGVETLSLAPTAGTTLDVSKVTGVTTIEGALKNNTGSVHTIAGGSVASDANTTVVTIDGIALTLVDDTGADSVSTYEYTDAASFATSLANAIAANATLTDKYTVTNNTNVIELREKVQDAGTITVRTTGTAEVSINGAAAATALTATSVPVNTVATSGTLGLSNLTNGATVKLQSANLISLATDGTTTQSTALNKAGAVTADVKDATLSTNTTDSLTVELNNNATSPASTTANKLFTVAQFNAAGVETLNINSIGTLGGNAIADLQATSAKAINVTGTAALTLTSAVAAATANLNASTFTGALTATFATTAYTDQSITGGAGNDAITFAANTLTGGDSVDLGAGTDTLTFTTNADSGILNVKNTETIKVINGTSDTAAVDLRNVTGLTKLVVDTKINDTTVYQLSDGLAVQLLSTGANTNDAVTLNGATTATISNVSLGADGTSTANAGVGYGSSSDDLVLGSGLKTLNLTVDGASYDGTADANSTLGILSGSTLETVAVNLSAGDGDLVVGTLTAAKLVSLTGTGGSSTVNNTIIRFSAIDDATSLATIDFSGVSAKVQLGFNGTSTYDSYKTKDGAVITTGSGDDTVSWNAQNNPANVINGGSNSTGGDTLAIFGNLLAPASIDLSSTTDQVSSFNGSNTSVQKGFENINLSNVTGAGATITATAAGSVIAGTPLADNISLGAGVDTVVFGAAVSGVADTILSFVVASDLINVELLAGGNVSAEVGIAANAAATATASTKVLIFADGADGATTSAVTDYTSLTNVATFLDANITQSTIASESYATIINDLVTSKAYIYNVITLADGTLGASQVTLVGIITTDAAVTTTNTIFTA